MPFGNFQIFQVLELPPEVERLEMNQAILVSKRVMFLNTLTNITNKEREDYQQVFKSISPSFWTAV